MEDTAKTEESTPAVPDDTPTLPVPPVEEDNKPTHVDVVMPDEPNVDDETYASGLWIAEYQTGMSYARFADQNDSEVSESRRMCSAGKPREQ